ncbi:flagellar protein FliT [Virgibacillus byunsanensis]|uniref:Flagellar protein FliT n=1 Tax=Virgibacillus byunsanensis TaxID=570945 RepID=A0ABW3LNI1_9BACI
MNRLSRLYNITVQLDKILNQTISSKNREEIITTVNQLIEQRGDYLNQVTPPLTADEKIIGKEVVVLNEKIEEQMNDLFDSLKQEMKQMKKQKKSNQSYINPYKSVQAMDGMFLDNKK